MEERPHKKEKRRVEECNSSERVQERLAKRIKLEVETREIKEEKIKPEIKREIKQEIKQETIKQEVKKEIKQEIKREGQNLELTSNEINQEQIISEENVAEFEPSLAPKDNTKDRSVAPEQLEDDRSIQETWRVKVLSRWSEDTIDKTWVEVPKNIKDWLATQPFHETKAVEPDIINWEKYYHDREQYEGGYDERVTIDPKVKIEEHLDKPLCVKIQMEYCYGDHDAYDEETSAFGQPFDIIGAPECVPDPDNNQGLAALRQVSRFLNTATKYMFMNGSTWHQTHPRLEFCGTSTFTKRLMSIVEWTLKGIETVLLEFGSSHVVTTYPAASKEFDWIPASFAGFNEVLLKYPNTRNKELFRFTTSSPPTYSGVYVTEDLFNKDRIKMLLSRRSSTIRLKILAHCLSLLGAERFHQYAQQTLNFLLAYLRLKPRPSSQFLEFAKSLFFAAQFTRKSEQENHYLSIIVSQHSDSLFSLTSLSQDLMYCRSFSIFERVLLPNFDEADAFWWIKWALHCNPQYLRQVMGRLYLDRIEIGRELEYNKLFSCVYLGYFFGCTIFRPYVIVRTVEDWAIDEYEMESPEVALRYLCKVCVPYLNMKSSSQQQYILQRFIVLSSICLVDQSLQDLCLFTAPCYDMSKVIAALNNPKFTTTRDDLDALARSWPCLFDLTYQYNFKTDTF